MPPEPFPCGRRDFRKHDRSASNGRAGAGGLGRGGNHKWRNQHQQQHQAPPPYRHHQNQQQQQQQQRWYSDFRSPRLLPPGQSKKGGWHMYSEDAGQGFNRHDRNLEDENCQPFASRGDGRYLRNKRGNRGSFTQKSWKNPSWAVATEPNSLGEIVTEVNNLRSIENTPVVSASLSDQSQAHSPVKEKNENTVHETTVKGQESEEENCLEPEAWKLLKRSRSLSSRSSCIGHSTSSKSLGHESVEVLAEVQQKNAALDRSLSVDVSCVRSKNAPSQSDGTGSRKKPRLGWGEGLAKYEKKRVDGPEDGTNKSGLTLSGFSTESSLSESINLLEKIPKVETLMECASPSTPSSAACRFSPGVQEKSFKEANLDCDAPNVSCSPRIASQAKYGGSTINLQNFELESIVNLSSSINELLQPNDPCSAENGDTQRMSMNKLLVWKVDVLKALEKTESEIESLETELKSSAIFPPEKAESSKGSRIVDVDKSGDSDKKCSQHVNNHVLVKNTSGEDNIWGSILSSNRDAARRALEHFNKLLPEQCINGSVESIVSSLPRNSLAVKERFLKRKQFLQFKEKVLTLKHKVFHHFWKQGRVVSIRTLRKTKKKFDPSRNGQRRSRSRVSSYVGGCQAVPSDEVIDFVNGLLSQSAFKPYRNSLKMPALILDKHVKLSRFISNNGLVKDPRTVEKERYMMNPWAHEETEIFIEKLAAFGKDFTKIASFLDHKTVADCIEFYYKNHKSNWFEEARKNSGFIKQRRSRTTTYLVASGKRRNPELNATSLDILGAASEIAVNIDNAVDIRQKFPSRTSFGDHLLKESDSLDMLNNERETEAADVLANICGSLSTEATSSSITTSLDLIDGYQDPVIPRISSSIKRASTPEVTQDEVDGECSDGSCSELNPTDWSDEEKSIFIQAVSSYGKDFVMVSRSVRTKSMNQCKVFFSKARKCLGLELVQPETGPVSGDDNGGSDIEDEFQMVKSEPDSETSNGENRLDPLDSTTNEPVFENLSNLGGIEDDKPVTDIKHSTKDQRVKDASFVSGCDHQIVAIASYPESEPRIKQEVDLSFLKASEENQCRSFLSNGDSNSVKVNDTNSGNGMIFKPLLAGNDSHASVDQKPDVQKRAEVGTCSAEKSGVSLLLQSGCLASATSSTLLSVPTKYQNASDRNPPLPVEVTGVDGRLTQNFPSHSLISTESSSKILQGYPVSLQTVKGKNGDEKLNPGWRTDFLLQKCKETRQTDVSPPASGGVKLFGKILTSPSPSPSPSSSSQQKPHIPIEDAHRPRHEPLNQKLSCDQKGDLDFSQSKSNLNNYVPTEGRFGFWDGSRIQRGTPPVPDSTLLLAKYPSAFSNFTLPPSVPQSREFSSSSIGLSIKEGETLVEMQRRMMYGGDRCSLTDPVAAIRMHYAKAEQLQMKGGNGVDEEDRWIGRRDVGR